MSTWSNKPLTVNPVLDYDFDKTTLANSGIQDVYGSSLSASDVSAPKSPSSCIKSRMEAGNNYGGMQLNYVFNTYTDMFVGLGWRTNAGFEGRQVGNKMFFMRGPGCNGVFLFGNSNLVAGSHKMLFSFNTAGIENSHITGSTDPGVPLFPNVSAGTLTVGTWFVLEAYIKKSTTNTSRDGIVRWWINGVLVGNYTNTNYAGAGLNEWVWSETWDGTVNPAPSVAWEHYLDHLYVGSSNAGVGGGGGVTPTLTSLSPSTFSLSPGGSQTCTASMTTTVTANTAIALSSSNTSAVTVPSSVTIPNGQSTASFAATAVGAGSSTITAVLSGVSRTSVGTVTSSGGGGTGGGASTTYTFASQYSGVQGQNQWSYRDTGGNLLVYNAGANKWEGDELYLAIFPSGFVHAYNATLKGAVLRWTAPGNGSASITGTALLYVDPAVGIFSIQYNSSTTLFTQNMAVNTAYPYSLSQPVSTGDVIDFVMSRVHSGYNNNTQLNPVVVFTPTNDNPLAPAISSFSPTSGIRGTSVTVVGANFSGTIANNIVTVNGTLATVTSASPTQLVFTVPQAATTGAVQITTSTGSATGSTFTVTDPVTPDIPPASNFGGNAFLLLVMP